MKKTIGFIIFLLILFLIGCTPEAKPQDQPTYSGGSCGVQANGNSIAISESANFFGLNPQQSRQYHYISIESSCLNKGYDGLKGWKVVSIGEKYLEIQYLCCKNALEGF